MIIKKYLANTEAEAVDAAKKELGQGVVIMNVRSVKHKGIMRFFRNPMKEVTVALEEESERVSSAVRDIARIARGNEQGAETPVDENEKQPENTTAQALFQQAVQNAVKSQNTPKPQGTEQAADASYRESTGNDDKAADENVSDMEVKLETIRSLLKDTLGLNEESDGQTTGEEPSESETFMKLLYNTMIENEVHERYANIIIDDLEKSRKSDTPIDHLLANIYQKMILKFGKPEPITPPEKNPKIVFFVGPTGVGKTTTIAKIASRFQVNQHKKIALLTTDTYRIAAAEQLRTYANILNVPFRVIYTTEEMDMAYRDFKDYDYILVDTAGHSHQNEEQKKVLKEFLATVKDSLEKEVYLVLSATTKYRDLISIADAYSDITPYKLIFTKLDETLTAGNLFNLRMHTGAAMSYVTCGQNVPDDIEHFNPQSTVKQLLGGRK